MFTACCLFPLLQNLTAPDLLEDLHYNYILILLRIFHFLSSVTSALPPTLGTDTSYLCVVLSRDADPEFGFIQSKELEAHLKEIMAVYDVEVRTSRRLSCL